MRLLTVFTAAAVAAVVVEAVDRSKFRRCDDAAFCRRHRHRGAEPELRLMPDSIRVVGEQGLLTGVVASEAGGSPPFDFRVAAFESGAVRVRLTEKDDRLPRWESPDIVLESGTKPTVVAEVTAEGAGLSPAAVNRYAGSVTYLRYGDGHVVAVQHRPLRVELYVAGGGGGDTPAIVVNDRRLTYFEHRRTKAESQVATDTAAAALADSGTHGGRKILDWGEDGKPIYEDGSHGDEHGAGSEAAKGADATAGRDVLAAASANVEPGMWEESFGTHHDSKPFGPTSVGVDISFPAATHVYGIPEHASSHALRATDGSEGGSEYTQPYRLYNLDVFEYELDNPMALYGSIPFMLAHGPAGHTVGVFWNNPTETYVDIVKGLTGVTPTSHKLGVGTHWISESGVFDLFLVPGPTPKAVVTQYTTITGTQALPPLFALGYHQCRWNYKDEADVYGVDAKFEEHGFPYDVVWLDIEHTDGKRYFTWDSHLFPNPADMQNKLAARGHKMVTIIDPHIKRDSGYRIHTDAQAQGLYVRNAHGGEYDGWCWPGSSSYLDFTNPKTRTWWADQFSLAAYPGSTLSLYTWNDMNEPSVFNGPEVSMNKDAKSIDGVEHREWHNLYGFYQLMATQEGQIRRSPEHNTRPFALSRAFYAGTQRYGAIWTGDNAAKWEHLAIAAPMLLTIGVTGLTFSGADVGGFFNNPSTELMIRWYQAGSFTPFFRAHAHIDTARREPWLFGDEVLATLRTIVRTRYTYLPLWYTAFYTAHITGVPTMRPLWMEYPTDPATFAMDDEWLVGSDLLVKPVTSASATSIDLYFPGGKDAVWYNAASLVRQLGGGRVTVPAPLHADLPVFQRGGSIIPRLMRPRRSSAQMVADPYTLVVALDAARRADGTLYLDDGNTFDYSRKNSFRLRSFQYAPDATGKVHTLRSSQLAGGKAFAPANTVERIIIAGAGSGQPTTVTAVDADGTTRPVSFDYDAATDVITLRRPDVKVAYDWTLQVAF